MRRTPVLTLALVCLVTALAAAEVGQLKFVESQPKKSASPAPVPLYTRTFAVAAPDCGTVNPKAKVATVGSGGAVALKVAVDSAEAGAEEPDLIRFDFSGKGNFKDKPTLPLKKLASRSSYKRYQVGPGTLQVPRGEETAPVHVAGLYYVRGTTFRYLTMMLSVAAEGSCRFGDKVLGVRVIDANGNLRVSDTVKISLKDGKVMGAQRGRLGSDMVLIDTDGETFRKKALEVPCGHRVRLGDTWYEVSVSDDAKITAKEVKVATGKVRIPHDRWSMTLINAEHMLSLSGGRDPVEVPAGQYVATNYREYVGSPGASRPAMVAAGRRVLYGAKSAVLTVEAGKTAEWAIGSPLTARAAVSQRSGTVHFRAEIKDAGGTDVDYVHGAKGARPQPPSVTVLNAGGEQVYQGKMKYG